MTADYDERVLPSIVNEVSKAVVARYNAAELLTMRDKVSRQISDTLMERARDFGIQLDDVAITHLSFSREYTAAVEAKQVALQESQRARYVVEQAKQEKMSIIIKAQGEAEASKMVGKALRDDKGFLALRRFDAATEVSETLAASANRMFLDSGSLLVDLNSEFGNISKIKK